MQTKALNPMDASWLYVESADTPMHVAGLMIFELPKNAAPDFFQTMFAATREHQQFYPPWNRRLEKSRLKSLTHSWIEDQDVDIDYHVRLSALPWPGGERELGMLIARLHSRPLDLRRPPWECNVIQGLEGNRFALYIKIHHALIDGVSAMRMLARMLAKTPDDLELPAFWAVPPEKRPTPPPLTAAADAVGGILGGMRQRFSAVPDLAGAARELLRAARSKTDQMGVPFKAPKSILNGRITGARRFATQIYSIERLKKLAKAADCTLNDIVLALCGAALRRFLKESNALPEQPLTAGIPVSVRPKDDQEQGNAISFMIATLGTNIADPVTRLEAISASTRRAKEHLQSLPKSAIESYTLLLMGPYILQLVSGLGGRTRPVFNITISNVPGPQQTLYLRGAKMVANYPVSLVTHGQAINITCHGYADTLNFGFIGCRDTLPHMQRIAVYTGEALEELEAAIYKGRGK
jgi:diacylglycerol O-acyltransferase